MTEDEIILTHILKCRSIDLVIDKPILTDAQTDQFEQFKARRQAGEPLQYILGTCNFMGLELTVNPSVLVPRPETEQLVDYAINYIKCHSCESSASGRGPAKGGGGNPVIKILDIGTGSGNIAIALAKLVPSAQIISVDVSPDALEIARANAKQHGLDERIKFIHKDITKMLPAGDFDLIISNPPYIPTSQINALPQDVQQEPFIALNGGVDGLDFYRLIIKYTPSLLRKGACLMMEFGDGQAEAVKKLLEHQATFSQIEIFKDLAGRDRIIKAIR